MENDKLEEFASLKEELTKELADLESHIGSIEQTYEQILPGLKKRRDALVHVLFDEAPVEITMNDHLTESASNTERLKKVVETFPGISKQDIREALPDLDEKTLDQTIKWCSKNNIIENRGTKQRPAWHLV